ncbi:hypothetical protein JCM8097_004296 [Rhodosporidiobolus ruineniae]
MGSPFASTSSAGSSSGGSSSRSGPQQQQHRPPFLRLSSYASTDDEDDTEPDTPLLPQHWRRSGEERRRSKDGGEESSSLLSSRPASASYAGTLRSVGRQHRLARLCYTLAVSCLAVTLFFATVSLGWAANVVYQRHNAYAQAVFGPPMVPEPVEVEERVDAFPAWMGRNGSRVTQGERGGLGDEVALQGVEEEESRLAAILSELDTRFDGLSLPSSTALPCADVSSSPDLLARYSPLRGVGSSLSHARAGPTLLALNLYNSAHVLPALSRTLVTLSSFLGPETVHVSIFENGSTDETTDALAHLAAALTVLGAPHTITSDPRATDWKKVDRIAQLALYRNIVLEPLTHSSPFNTTSPPQDIVFINDVFLCPRDVLELLFQRKTQEADAACAMDWRQNKGMAKLWNGSVKFYDNWVARTITGHMFRHKLDILSEWRDGFKELWDQPAEEYSRKRFQAGLPLPVYSCWNGALALSSLPFLSSDIAPRYAGPASSWQGRDGSNWARTRPMRVGEGAARFRSALGTEGECAASECKTIARDLWTRGFDRWLVVPTVGVTYDLATYTHKQLNHLASLNRPASSTLSLTAQEPVDESAEESTMERIQWSKLTPPSKTLCFPWARGFHIDLEMWRATWERPFARLQFVKWVDKVTHLN